jgi:crotonobetainyl-CoA:carnitine CoA-transferase CaiB-like acyl-CoA transferase
MTMPDTATRSVSYLQGFRFLVLGHGTLAAVATAVLSTLGADARQYDGDPASVDQDEWADFDAVICDRTTRPPDEVYLERVRRWLEAVPPGTGRAWVTVSAFGLDGPAKDFKGSEHVCAAAGGLLTAVYDDKGRIYPIPGDQAMQTSAHMAALAALYGVSLGTDECGPVHLDLSAQEAVFFCANQQTPMNLLNRCGVPTSHSRYSAPSDPFPCTDGEVQIIVVDDHQFARFLETIERPDLIPIFPNLSDRVQYADMINSVCAEWTRVRSKGSCEEALQAAGVPAAAVRSISEVVASPQFRARHWPDRAEEPDDGVVLPALVSRRPIHKHVGRRSLNHFHVLEFSNVLAGPLAGAILGALGAVVVRVEDPQRLDMYRQNGPFVDGIRGPERSAYFQGANYCKRSIPANTDVARQARPWADAVLENVGMKRIEQSGVATAPDDDAKPSLVLSVSAFGRTGPCASFRGYAQNVHAFSGLEYAVKEVVGGPVTLRTALGDYSSAVWAATLCAAWWIGGTVDDERVDLSMSEVVANRIPVPEDAPLDRDLSTDATVDLLVDLGGSYLALTLPTSDWPEAVAGAVGLSPADTREPADLEEKVLIALKEMAASNLGATVRGLQQAGIACYGAGTPDVLVADPQLNARGFFVPLVHPLMGETRVFALPWKVVGRPRSANYWRVPMLGEHEDWATEAFAAGGP